MKRCVLYSEANYVALVRDHGYFVDKTAYVAQLEPVRNPVFLRPRRFGKTLLCSILRHYYDLNTGDQFEGLFGHTWIGQHPTGRQNQYIILALEFVGKYHEKFAGLRRVIKFRYYANAQLRKLNKTVDTFTLQQEDTEQIDVYAADLHREYPEAIIAKFVIYCFGNSGFRVFPVT